MLATKPSAIPVPTSKVVKQRSPPQHQTSRTVARTTGHSVSSGQLKKTTTGSENAPPKKVSWVGTAALDPQYLQATPATVADNNPPLLNPLLHRGSTAAPLIASNYFPQWSERRKLYGSQNPRLVLCCASLLLISRFCVCLFLSCIVTVLSFVVSLMSGSVSHIDWFDGRHCYRASACPQVLACFGGLPT